MREKPWKLRLEFAASLEVKNVSLFSLSKRKKKYFLKKFKKEKEKKKQIPLSGHFLAALKIILL